MASVIQGDWRVWHNHLSGKKQTPTWTLSELLRPCPAHCPLSRGLEWLHENVGGQGPHSACSGVGKAERTQGKAERTQGTKGNYLRQLPENNPIINIPAQFLLWRNFILVGELFKNGCFRSYPTITIQPTSLHRNAKRSPSEQNGTLNLETTPSPFMGQHTHGFLLLLLFPAGQSRGEVTELRRWHQTPGFAIFSQPGEKVGQEQVHELLCHCRACLGRFLPWTSCSGRWTLGRTCGLWFLCNHRTPVPFPGEKPGAQTCHRERLWEISSQKKKPLQKSGTIRTEGCCSL